MDSISNIIFTHNNKPTGIVCFCYPTSNIKHFSLNLPLMLMRRLNKNNINFQEIYTFQPESLLFNKSIDFDIVIFASHLSSDDSCNEYHRHLFEYFSEKTIDIFTDITKLIEKYPSSQIEPDSDFSSQIILRSFTYPQSPIPDPNPSMILENLYLGSINFATDNRFLDDKKIFAIVSVMEDSHPFSNKAINMRFHHIPIQDRFSVNIIEYINECNDFIKNCHKDGLNVYVHCAMGISRSISFVIAFLMETMNMKFDDAFKFVKQRRPQAEPNFGFHYQLLSYEKILNDKQNKN